ASAGHQPGEADAEQGRRQRVVADRAAEIAGEPAAALAGVAQGLVHQLSGRQPALDFADGLLEMVALRLDLALEFGRALVAVVAVHQNFSFTTSASCASEW